MYYLHYLPHLRDSHKPSGCRHPTLETDYRSVSSHNSIAKTANHLHQLRDKNSKICPTY